MRGTCVHGTRTETGPMTKPGQLGFINPGSELFTSHQIAGSAGHKNHFGFGWTIKTQTQIV